MKFWHLLKLLPCSFPRAAIIMITNYTTYNRNLLSHRSGGQEPKIKVLAGFWLSRGEICFMPLSSLLMVTVILSDPGLAAA